MEMSTLIPLESLKRYVKYTDGYSPALEVDDYIMAVGPYSKQVLPVSSPQLTILRINPPSKLHY